MSELRGGEGEVATSRLLTRVVAGFLTVTGAVLTENQSGEHKEKLECVLIGP